jgi:hypothetical protein
MKQATNSATFRANSNTQIAGAGQAVIVVIGKEYTLPNCLYNSAVAAGMSPLTPLDEDTPDGTIEQVAEPQLTVDDKFDLLVEACETLILDGAAKNFTQLLKPKVTVVLSMVNFDFTKQLMLRAYDEAVFRTEKNEDST